jgi:hypothetical protein
LQGDGASADLSVEVVLDQILFVKPGPRLGGFGPQVRDVVASSHLEGHEVVDFILARRPFDDPVFAVHLTTDLGRYVPY